MTALPWIALVVSLVWGLAGWAWGVLGWWDAFKSDRAKRAVEKERDAARREVQSLISELGRAFRREAATRFERIWAGVQDAALDTPDHAFAQLVQQILADWRTVRAAGRFNEEATAVRNKSFEDAKERPWLKAKPIYPVTGFPDTTDETYAAGLIASLDFSPPDLGGAK